MLQDSNFVIQIIYFPVFFAVSIFRINHSLTQFVNSAWSFSKENRSAKRHRSFLHIKHFHVGQIIAMIRKTSLRTDHVPRTLKSSLEIPALACQAFKGFLTCQSVKL